MCLFCHKYGTPSVHNRTGQHHSGGKEIRIRSWSMLALTVSGLLGTLPKLLHCAKPPHKTSSLLAAEVCKKTCRFVR